MPALRGSSGVRLSILWLYGCEGSSRSHLRHFVWDARGGRVSAAALVAKLRHLVRMSVFAKPRLSAALLPLGALFLVGAQLTGMCELRAWLVYTLVVALAVAAVGILVDKQWARMLGRIVCWVTVFLFAMMIVPDWDDAMFRDSYELHGGCALIAAYFLLGATLLGIRR